MSATVTILAFAGSARKDSVNKKLVRVAAEGARAGGGIVTMIDLRDYPLPVFDQDYEAENGPPENARKLKQMFVEHQGLLIASPEYNSSVTPLLKNTLDWISRSIPGESPLAAFQGKVACLMSASPGGLGGLRGLVHVRAILGNIGVIVLPDQIAVPKAHEAFDDAGQLRDAKLRDGVHGLGRTLASTVRKLKTGES